MSITAKRLRDVLHYAPLTGVWTWIKPTSDRMHKGDSAGRLANGRRSIQIDGSRYYSYRLAFLYMTGRFPRALVDHKNLKKDDDRWENLREATYSQNGANSKLVARTTTGLKGVSFTRNKKRFTAFACVKGANEYLGTFDCPAAAHFAYLIAADKAFGAFARPS